MGFLDRFFQSGRAARVLSDIEQFSMPEGIPRFSLRVPADWAKHSLPQSFAASGGILRLLHTTKPANLNVSVGPMEASNMHDPTVRASLLRDQLNPTPHDRLSIKIAPLAGEDNAIQASWLDLAVGGCPTGFISAVHNNLEYVIQWYARPDLIGEVHDILNSFSFA